MKNLFAHTDLGHDYPAYLSINKDDDGRHRVTVRSAGNGGRDLGEIHVSPETLEHMATDVLAAINGETPPSPATNFNEAIDAHYKAMVDRFLCWKLPQDFAPDCGISFDGRGKDAMGYEKTWPVGTNLLHAGQALEMFKHCLPSDLLALTQEDDDAGTCGLCGSSDPANCKGTPDGPCAMADRETDANQCCGKCEKPEVAAALAPSDNPVVLRAIIEDLAGRLQTADYVILALLIKAGGEVVVTSEDCGKVPGNVVTNEVSEDKSTFTFRAVAAPQQVAQQVAQ